MNTLNVNSSLRAPSVEVQKGPLVKQGSGNSIASASARSGASSVTKQFHNGPLSTTSMAATATMNNGSVTAYKSSDFTRTRLLQELELVYKEFKKA